MSKLCLTPVLLAAFKIPRLLEIEDEKREGGGVYPAAREELTDIPHYTASGKHSNIVQPGSQH